MWDNLGPALNFDANASHSLLPEIKDWLRRDEFEFLNPSSVHRRGQAARQLIEEARDNLRLLLGLKNERIIFTSGATEANNAVLLGALVAAPHKRHEIVVSAFEHPSILEPARQLAAAGAKLIEVAPSAAGVYSADDFLANCSDSTTLLSVMFANNEIGHILPVAEIFAKMRQRFPRAVLHCDAVQALGKVDFRASEVGSDLLTFSGHKIGALAGVGALVVLKPESFKAGAFGGAQEDYSRAGTENILGIYSFGLAAKMLRAKLAANIGAQTVYRARAQSVITQAFPRAEFLSRNAAALPNTLSVRFPGVRADDLVVALDLEGICISSGAACSSGKPNPSHVLLAFGLEPQAARETVRLSFEEQYEEQQFARGLECLAGVLERLAER